METKQKNKYKKYEGIKLINEKRSEKDNVIIKEYKFSNPIKFSDKILDVISECDEDYAISEEMELIYPTIVINWAKERRKMLEEDKKQLNVFDKNYNSDFDFYDVRIAEFSGVIKLLSKYNDWDYVQEVSENE